MPTMSQPVQQKISKYCAFVFTDLQFDDLAAIRRIIAQGIYSTIYVCSSGVRDHQRAHEHLHCYLVDHKIPHKDVILRAVNAETMPNSKPIIGTVEETLYEEKYLRIPANRDNNPVPMSNLETVVTLSKLEGILVQGHLVHIFDIGPLDRSKNGPLWESIRLLRKRENIIQLYLHVFGFNTTKGFGEYKALDHLQTFKKELHASDDPTAHVIWSSTRSSFGNAETVMVSRQFLHSHNFVERHTALAWPDAYNARTLLKAHDMASEIRQNSYNRKQATDETLPNILPQDIAQIHDPGERHQEFRAHVDKIISKNDTVHLQKLVEAVATYHDIIRNAPASDPNKNRDTMLRYLDEVRLQLLSAGGSEEQKINMCDFLHVSCVLDTFESGVPGKPVTHLAGAKLEPVQFRKDTYFAQPHKSDVNISHGELLKWHKLTGGNVSQAIQLLDERETTRREAETPIVAK